ncbi:MULTISPECIES: helix-turn-helix domain-containing protein [unclassified Marinimicrobium]|uniref:helix-turn-helix domain-containing protein n=1 Tax=unclassified Marinimicrobium TaxID=2632100 RepID=UPI000C39AE44|nr:MULTISPECIES: helix-turn-helix domain-containing protein [unclassified Marinimicrobium]MAN51979.1 XRE family transcriptional regulator [Marinimicrobium sp.]
MSQTDRDPEAIALGERLRLVRELNGLSQRELARRAGVTNSNISLIEQGQISPSVGSLAKLLDAIPLSLAQFFALDTRAPLGIVLTRDQVIRSEHPELGLVIERFPRSDCHSLSLERLQFAPGADTGAEPWQLSSARSGWLLSGRLELTLGVRCYTLNEGDGCQLPQGQWFRVRNTGSVPAIAVVARGADCPVPLTPTTPFDHDQ